MCGVAGIYDPSMSDGDARQATLGMLAQIIHRGPDGIGVGVGNGCAIGSARLAVVDIAGGNQPIIADGGRYRLVFNGEIFNHRELRRELEALGRRFHTCSDTEALLHAIIQWDVAALDRLEGQFAFAFFDVRRRRLILGRDRFGERPLFIGRYGRGLAFASEIKSLFSLPGFERKPAAQKAADLCLLWTSPPGQTVFEAVDAVPPGHYVELTPDGVTTTRWYALSSALSRRFAGNAAAAGAETAFRLRESVARRLRADVEVGCYLSGGLDSAIIGRLARDQVGDRLRSFSVSFADADFDESEWQLAVARHLGTEHTAVRIKEGDIAAVFPEVIRHCETPLFRAAPAPMYLLARAVREAGIKVVLTGEGADEAFLGYAVFKETLFRQGWNDFPDDAARHQALVRLHPYLAHFKDGEASLMSFYSRHLEETVPGLFSHEPRFGIGRLAFRCLRPEVAAAADPLSTLAVDMERLHPGFSEWDPLTRAQALEYALLLGGYLLSSQGDRMTSAFGVEGRCPFLDHNVAELGLELPVNMRLRDGVEKAVLRDVFGAALPPEISGRVKNPYRSPDAAAFLHGADAPWIEEVLSPSNLAANTVFDPVMVKRLTTRLRRLPVRDISTREDQALVLILSTLLLERLFVHDFTLTETAAAERLLLVDYRDGDNEPGAQN